MEQEPSDAMFRFLAPIMPTMMRLQDFLSDSVSNFKSTVWDIVACYLRYASHDLCIAALVDALMPSPIWFEFRIGASASVYINKRETLDQWY
jgi:hypothetical protein